MPNNGTSSSINQSAVLWTALLLSGRGGLLTADVLKEPMPGLIGHQPINGVSPVFGNSTPSSSAIPRFLLWDAWVASLYSPLGFWRCFPWFLGKCAIRGQIEQHFLQSAGLSDRLLQEASCLLPLF